ncbi:unnamed protein product [Nippostrongylus brasiliensis]|uniref:Serine protease K12H4.7 n=1 Tax=Nippostrongylus brasiliensis TaxID=27835 RepID=A0A158QYD0_NIPBR|nr:unnamed protein product [Nippostrongylus brasiliensis]
MRNLWLLFLLALQAWPVTSSWTPRFHLGRPMFGMKINHELLGESEKISKLQTGFGATEGRFTQKLDHFDSNSTATWSQRYFSNFQYQITGSNAVFLMIGGEGPESIRWVQNENYPFVRWAKERGAVLFDLEHRFYGESQPTVDQSVANLKYLSSRQAIEDIAAFIKAMNVKYNLQNASWITFGGSYSGALSLWAREKHPELIAGAVGSSAPVQAEVDFWKYLQVVEDSLRAFSNDCAENVRIGFAQVIDMMNTEDGRQKLSDLFVLDPPLSNLSLNYNDVQNFYTTIFGNFQGAVQYSQDNAGAYATGYSVPNVCAIMTNKSIDPLTALQDVNVYMAGMYGPFVNTPNSYDDMVAYLQWDKFSGADVDHFCVLGRISTFIQRSGFMFTNSIESFAPEDDSLYSNLCRDVFGSQFNSDYINNAVRSTLNYYGGSAGYTGTNVVIPNGSVDPWHALGKYTSSDPSVVWYLVNGTAHCADMYPPSAKDPAGLTTVRKLIERNIDMWLSKSPNPYNPGTAAQIAVNSNADQLTEQREKVPVQARSPAAGARPLHNIDRTAFRKMHLARPPHGFRPPPDTEITATPYDYETGFFTQPVNHFDSANPDTFQQRYFKNGQWAQPGGPMFLMIGGEGPESSRWVLNENITYLTWAKKFGATVYLLEHRYYGESIVYDRNGQPNGDLTFLSSLQMLNDVANFIRTINSRMSTPATWITFGGSYSEYLEVVEQSVRSYSEECADNIAQGFQSMHQMVLTGPGRKNLSDIFTLSPPWDPETDVSEIDVQFFFSNIYGQFQGAVQYSGDNTGGYALGYGIPEMCNFMTNSSSDPLTNIALFNQYMTVFYQGGGAFKNTANSYADFIAYLKAWGTEQPGFLFTHMCADVFGAQYTAATVEQSVQRTLQLYGGRDNYKGTNVVIPNGSVDPWHALGKYTSNDPSVVWYLINGTAHCADMYPARPEDVPDLANVRQLIETNIAKWLTTAPASTSAPTTRTTTTTTAKVAVVTTANPPGPSGAATTQSPVEASTKGLSSHFNGKS